MKKFVFTVMLLSLSFVSTLLAVEQCDEWFQKNDFGIVGTMGKSGTGVVLDQNGELTKVYTSGTVKYDFDNEVIDALNEANLVAKVNLAKFLKEGINNDEIIEKIASKKITLTKHNTQIDESKILKEVHTRTTSMKNHADALLTGVIKVCESNDAATKQVQVVLAVSPKTAAAASKAANMFNKEIGSRKSVEEYAAERQNTGDGNNNIPSANESGSQPVNSSFSNKTKNMNF